MLLLRDERPPHELFGSFIALSRCGVQPLQIAQHVIEPLLLRPHQHSLTTIGHLARHQHEDAFVLKRVLLVARNSHQSLKQLAQPASGFGSPEPQESNGEVDLDVYGHRHRGRGDDDRGLPPVISGVFEVISLFLIRRRTAVDVVANAHRLAHICHTTRLYWRTAANEHALAVVPSRSDPLAQSRA